jgi:hypothetical protein
MEQHQPSWDEAPLPGALLDPIKNRLRVVRLSRGGADGINLELARRLINQPNLPISARGI